MDTRVKKAWGGATAFGVALGLGAAALYSGPGRPAEAQAGAQGSGGSGRIVKSDAEWRKILTRDQYYVLRREGTERAFSGDYHPRRQAGAYLCAGCGLALFSSGTMFDSGTGWPSFWQPLRGRVEERVDADGERVEVECARCGGHLGHVFQDGPAPTGLRYCMNSVAMKFAPAPRKAKAPVKR